MNARSGVDGFTLLEAMAGLAVTAAVVLGLSTIAGQWLPNWRAGFAALQRADLLSVGLERVGEDLSSAEFVLPSAAATSPLFDGDALGVTFVRSAIGPNAGPGLDVVRLAETRDENGFALVRTRAAFAPTAPDARAAPFALGDPVVLVRSPFRVTFAYAGPDRVWRESWRGGDSLPEAVRVVVRETLDGQVLAVSTAILVRVTASFVEAGGAGGAGAPPATPQPGDASTPAPSSGQAPL